MKAAVTQPTVDNVPTNPSFSAELKGKIRTLVGCSALSLRQLALQMEGAYPTDILAAIQLLKADGIEVDIVDQHRSDARTSISGLVTGAELPEPHPIDYDWRFSDDSLTRLSQLLGDIKSEKIAILGAPTLFLYLAKTGVPTFLYDKNSHLVEALQSLGLSSATCCNLFEAHFDQPSFDAVVADPPWYSDHYASFIRNSAGLLMPGGVLLLSVLPRLTRPSAAQDRMAIIRDAYESGLDIIDIQQSALAYDSPPFEQAALNAEGISLKDWRRGDLFIFKRSAVVRQQSGDPVIENDSQWNSFSVGKTIVKVKNRSSDSASIEFGALSPSGDVHLHSVSRRAPFRADIDVWTSRNLAVWMSHPDLLCEILADHERGRTFDETISRIVKERNLKSGSDSTLREIVNLLVEDAKIADNA